MIYNTNHEGSTALHLASTAKDTKRLLTQGFDPNVKNNNGMTPLHMAKSATQASLLVNAGASVNERTAHKVGHFESGCTPIFFAKNKAHAKVLLDAGAMLTENDNQGQNVLHYFVKSKAMLDFFLNLGVDVNNVSPYLGSRYSTTSVLHKAICYSSIEVCEFLLQKGADPNIENCLGQTPLFNVSTVEQVDLLMSYGANISHVNNDGKTAIDILRYFPSPVAESLARRIELRQHERELKAEESKSSYCPYDLDFK